MRTLKIYIKKGDDIFITEETIPEVYEFEFDFEVKAFIIKYVFMDLPHVKIISFKDIKEIKKIRGENPY